MAEAAATAIGIISFGLTVCKGLYTYYHAYTGFDSNISSAHESIAQVARTLILLKDSCNDPDLDHERKDRVATCVCSCEDSLKNLNTKLQQLRTADPEGFREKTKARFKRHAYPFKEQSLKELRDNAVESQRQLAFAIQILDLAEKLKSQRVLDYLETWSNGVTITIDRISDDTQRLLSIARAGEIDKIKVWLSPPDPWTNHHAARSLHQPGTGKWVLDSDVYQAWIGGSTRHLWLCGKAGCGKTILSSTIVEDVQLHCCQAVNFGLAPFYFTFTDRGKQSYEAMLRSLIAQLGLQEPGLPALQEQHDQRHKLKGELNVQNLESILLVVLATYDAVFMVLDALDECPEEGNARSKLFDGLNNLVKEAPNLKILMTSRDISDIRDCMVRLPAQRLPVMTGAVNKDIHSYVAQQLSAGQYFKKLKRESLDLIQTTITRQADGMFRWAYCQLFELSQSKSTRPSRVENVLKTLPATLDETYARMLERIGPADRGDALTLLRWLAYAMRPITLAELQTAVVIRPEDDQVDDGDEGDLEDSLSILAGLVVFSDDVAASNSSTDEGEDSIHHEASAEATNLTPGTHIRLAHFSVKEYLQSTRISGSNASFFGMEAPLCHRYLSQSCLTYLTYYSQVRQEGPKRRDYDTFPLLDYAAKQWYKHSKLQSGGDVSREVALLSCEKAKSNWLRIYNRYLFSRGFAALSIYCAIRLSLPRVVVGLLKAGEDVNTSGPYREPVLATAVSYKDQAMVELLLTHGADVNAANDRSALLRAAENGLPLTKLLVDHGADVNVVCNDGTALSVACARGHRQIVHFLLERGARVDTVETMETTALIAASSFGHIEIVELLIAKGADVNRKSMHKSALHATIALDCTDIAAMLIDAGADVNAEGSNVLFDALRLGKDKMVPFLEAKGANKLTVEQLSNALIQVCKHQNESTQRAIGLLLDRGADPNAEEGGALLAALEYGQEAQAALLEARGAKKLTLEQLNDALVRVCRRQLEGTLSAVEMLLVRGADPNAEEGGALLAALEYGQEAQAALLEARGAKKLTLEQMNDALVRVCRQPYDTILTAVEMLLDRGADVNAHDGGVLLAALKFGQEHVVVLLEARGAKNPTLEQLNDALIDVREYRVYGSKRAIPLLLDRGANAGVNSASAKFPK